MSNRTYRCGTPKPFWRGVSHGIFSIIYFFVGWLLLHNTYNWSLLLFIISHVFGYSASFFYHFVHWSSKYDIIMHKLDYIGIFVLMISPLFTYCNYLLPYWLGKLILTCLSVIFGIGLYEILHTTKRFMMTCKILYALVYIIELFVMIILNINTFYHGLIMLSMIIYLIGFIIFFTKKPDPYPAYFGYHELFHLCTIVGSLIHCYVNYNQNDWM